MPERIQCFRGARHLPRAAKVVRSLAQQCWAIPKHPEARITIAAKSTSVFRGCVIVIPAKFIGSSADGAFFIEEPARSIRRFIEAGSFVGFRGAPKSPALVSRKDFGDSAYSTFCGAGCVIYLRETVPEPCSRRSGSNLSTAQFPVVACNAKAAGAGWLAAARGRAKSAIGLTWG